MFNESKKTFLIIKYVTVSGISLSLFNIQVVVSYFQIFLGQIVAYFCSSTEYSDGTSLVQYVPIKIIWEMSLKNTYN